VISKIIMTEVIGARTAATAEAAGVPLDLAPLLNKVAEPGITPVVTLEAAANGGAAVAVDPTGHDATHGTVVVTLELGSAAHRWYS
jgi:hypothetical protein